MGVKVTVVPVVLLKCLEIKCALGVCQKNHVPLLGLVPHEQHMEWHCRCHMFFQATCSFRCFWYLKILFECISWSWCLYYFVVFICGITLRVYACMLCLHWYLGVFCIHQLLYMIWCQNVFFLLIYSSCRWHLLGGGTLMYLNTDCFSVSLHLSIPPIP